MLWANNIRFFFFCPISQSCHDLLTLRTPSPPLMFCLFNQWFLSDSELLLKLWCQPQNSKDLKKKYPLESWWSWVINVHKKFLHLNKPLHQCNNTNQNKSNRIFLKSPGLMDTNGPEWLSSSLGRRWERKIGKPQTNWLFFGEAV